MIDHFATGRRHLTFPEAACALTWAIGLSYVAGAHEAMAAGLRAYVGQPAGDATPDSAATEGAEIIDIAEFRRLRAV